MVKARNSKGISIATLESIKRDIMCPLTGKQEHINRCIMGCPCCMDVEHYEDGKLKRQHVCGFALQQLSAAKFARLVKSVRFQ